MKYVAGIALRAMYAIIVVVLVSFAASGIVSAQEGTGVYDIKVASAYNGLPEGGLAFTVEFDNGAMQDFTIGEEGVYQQPIPAGATEAVAVIVSGVRYAIASYQLLCIPLPPHIGGCWCLCLQWIYHPPWIIYPRLFWYYNPCCP